MLAGLLDAWPVILCLLLWRLGHALLLCIAAGMLLTLLWHLAWRGRTPGKRLLGLRLRGTGCLTCRELRKLGPPMVALLALYGMQSYVATAQGASPHAVVAPLLALTALALAAVITTLIQHNTATGHQTRYDTATGFHMHRG